MSNLGIPPKRLQNPDPPLACVVHLHHAVDLYVLSFFNLISLLRTQMSSVKPDQKEKW